MKQPNFEISGVIAKNISTSGSKMNIVLSGQISFERLWLIHGSSVTTWRFDFSVSLKSRQKQKHPPPLHSREIGIFVTRWVTLSPPTIFVEKLYKILKILDKSNCIVNFRSMSKRLTQQTARKAVSKLLGRRLKNSEGKGIF